MSVNKKLSLVLPLSVLTFFYIVVLIYITIQDLWGNTPTLDGWMHFLMKMFAVMAVFFVLMMSVYWRWKKLNRIQVDNDIMTVTKSEEGK